MNLPALNNRRLIPAAGNRKIDSTAHHTVTSPMWRLDLAHFSIGVVGEKPSDL
jgi:hypothetical protein